MLIIYQSFLHQIYFILIIIHNSQKSVCKPPTNTPMQSNTSQNKLKQQVPTQYSPTSCAICQKNCQSLTPLISYSLNCKYSSKCIHPEIYISNITPINQIMQQAISPHYIAYRDFCYYDEDEQNMKRQYKQQQFPKKISMLSQYYRYHRNLPVWNSKQVDNIMANYYNKAKDVDYKKIKQIIKKQQGISLSTHKSFSSIQDESFTKKSRYSDLLNDLDHSNDSLILKDLCNKIGTALKKVKFQQNIIKGTYYSGQIKFQQYLRKQNRRKINSYKKQDKGLSNNANDFFKKKSQKLKQKERQNSKSLKKLHTKIDQPLSLKQMHFPSNHSLKDKKYVPLKSAKNIQKQKQRNLDKLNLKGKIKLVNKNKQKQKLRTPNQSVALAHEQYLKSQRNKSVKNPNTLSQVKNVYPCSGRSSLVEKEKQEMNNQIHGSTLNIDCKSKNKSNQMLKSIKKFSLKDMGSYDGAQKLKKVRSFQKQNTKKQQCAGQHSYRQNFKSPQQKCANKLKIRSSSSNNINLKSNYNTANAQIRKVEQNQSSLKKQKVSEMVKTARGSGKANIPICLVKGSLIQLGLKEIRGKSNQAHSLCKQKNKQNKLPMKANQKIVRTNSLNKIQYKFNQHIERNNINEPNYLTQRQSGQQLRHNHSQSLLVQDENKKVPSGLQCPSNKKGAFEKNFTKKKSFVVQNILQKKLGSFKRKQAAF